MWRELELVPEQNLPPIAERLRQHLQQSRGNGGAHFASFRSTPHPVLSWFIRSNRLKRPWIDFPDRIVTHPVVRQTLLGLHIPEKLPEPLILQEIDTFDFEAALVRELVSGGAYHQFTLTRRDARLVASEFIEAFPQQRVGYSETAWTPWFAGIAWDGTWIGLNAVKKRVWLLCVTDGD